MRRMNMLFDLNQIGIPIFLVDVEDDGRFRMRGMNTTAECLFGYPASRVAGKTFEECYSPRMVDLLTGHYRTCVALREVHQFDDYADLKDGRKWFRTTLSPCIEPRTGRVTQIMAVSQNITSVMQMYEKAEATALTDSLTGLPNRRRFDEAVRDACDEAVYSQRGFSLCVVDLDDLKGINDTFGHQAGDDAIRGVGDALRGFVKPDEMAARIGGDEFCLLLRTADRPELDERLATFRGAISKGLPISGLARTIHLSIGGATWLPGDDAADILALADVAMYAEKCRRRPSLI